MSDAPEALRYPASPVRAVRDTYHGVEVVDPYRWLEDPSSHEVRLWVAAQDRLARRVLSASPFRASLRREFLSIVRGDRIPARGLFAPRTGPTGSGSRFFWLSRPGSSAQTALHYLDSLSDRPIRILDPIETDRSGTTSILEVSPAWDGSKVAYGLSVHGTDVTTLHVRDVRSSRTSDRIPNVRFTNIAWRHDGSGFYYSNWPGPGMAGRKGKAQVFFHRLRSPAAEDRPIFGEGFHPTQGVSDLVVSPDDRHLIIFVERLSASTELYALDLDEGREVRPMVLGLPALFIGDGNSAVRAGRLIAVTDHHAPKRRVVSIPIDDPRESSWKELVPEDADILEGISVVGNRMVLRYLHNASSRLVVCAADGTRLREVPLPGIGTVYPPTGEGSGDQAVITYLSFQTPRTLFRFRPDRGPLRVLGSPSASIRGASLSTELVRYRSRDGTEVTMFLVRNKRAKRGSPGPALLEGYGGFGISVTPYFDPGVLPFLRDGGMYAVPQLRGGAENGSAWHDAGKREKKQNVFDDFIAAAEWLIEEGYTDPDHLAIAGGSNGGLLVGATVTQRPELFRAVVCAVPVLDLLRYQLFDGGSLWVPEYGSAEDPDDFAYLLKYSPYHQVRQGIRYPAILLMTADTDNRVNPMHARKMAARLQSATSSTRPILLRTERKTGHGFGKSVEQRADQLTDFWSFLYDQLGITNRAR
jgi:prolyl oligopeptidase